MAGPVFPPEIGEWLDTFDDAEHFTVATPEEVDAFAAEGWDVPDSVRDLWLEYGSCYIDGQAAIEGTAFEPATLHGLDDSEHGLHEVWRQHPELKDERLLPILSDIEGNVITWSAEDQRVYAHAYEPPSKDRGVLGTSVDALWDMISIDEYPVPDMSAVEEPGTYPDVDDCHGLVEQLTLARDFTNYVLFVVDTDEGEIFTGDLDEHGLGATRSSVTVALHDDEVTATLARAEVQSAPADLRLLWEGELDSPTREIGIADASGIVVMYCHAAEREHVRIYGDAASEQARVVVLVGDPHNPSTQA